MALRQNSEDSEDERNNEGDNYDYNNGIPPYEGAMWDNEFRNWVSNPIDSEIYDEEGNYRILPEDIIVEPATAAAAAAVLAPSQPQESRRDQMRRLMRERVRAPAPVVVVPPPLPPTPPIEDPRIVEARIGLPTPWEAHISNTYNVVYYFDPRNGNKQWERPTMGGKRTRRRPHPRSRPRSNSRTKHPRRKGAPTRRKRATTRRK
jgi:hypothetical protein